MYLISPKSEFDKLRAPKNPIDVFTNPWEDYALKCAEEAHEKFKIGFQKFMEEKK